MLEHRFFLFRTIHGELLTAAKQVNTRHQRIRISILSTERFGVLLLRLEIQRGHGFITYADPPCGLSLFGDAVSPSLDSLRPYKARSRWCQVLSLHLRRRHTDKDDAAEVERSNKPSGQRDEKKGRTKEGREEERTSYPSAVLSVMVSRCESIPRRFSTPTLSFSLFIPYYHPCSLIPPFLLPSLYSSCGLPRALWHRKLRSRR